MPEQSPAGSASDVNLPLWTRAVNYLASQPFNNVLTAGVIISVGLGLFRGVPYASEKLAEEWERQRNYYVKEMTAERLQHAEDRKSYEQVFEKMTTRFEVVLKNQAIDYEKALERQTAHCREMLDRREKRGAIEAIMPPATAKQEKP